MWVHLKRLSHRWMVADDGWVMTRPPKHSSRAFVVALVSVPVTI